MFALKLEQNLFDECSPDKIAGVRESLDGDSIYRSLDVDFSLSVNKMTVEKRKYPYFFKYYLYFGDNLQNPIDFKTEEGIRFLLAFYGRYCPQYLKETDYEKDRVLSDYFYTEKVPGEAMQHFTPGDKAALGSDPGEEPGDRPAISALEGYHAFSEEERTDIAGQLEALKSQFADQLKEIDSLLNQVRGEG